MNEEQRTQMECQAAFEWLMRCHGDRLTREMVDGLRGAVEGVMKNVAAVRSVPLENGEAPLGGFVPVREEG